MNYAKLKRSTTIAVMAAQTTSIAAANACFNVQYLGGCLLRLDASCSTGSIASYSWILDKNDDADGPYVQTGAVVIQDYGGKDGDKCSKKTVANQLTVVGPGNVSVLTLSFTFPEVKGLRSSGTGEPIESSFTSFLDVQPFDGSVRGTLVVNGRERGLIDNSAPSTHRYHGVTGLNSIEAAVTGSAREGFWSFDFSRAEHFVLRSVQVQTGQVVSQSSHQLRFRVSGAAGERIVFRYELAYADPGASPR